MTSARELEGFLVLLATPCGMRHGSRTERCPYMGVDRGPTWPTDVAVEQEPLDDYVFGSLKDFDTNLIPDYRIARLLYDRFALSPRSYEIIACTSDPSATIIRSLCLSSTQPRGYDVAAVRADYWSIADDLSCSPWAAVYQGHLNDFGLFNDREIAQAYLEQYISRGEPDCDSPFEVFHITRIVP